MGISYTVDKWIILPLEYTNELSKENRILREAYWQRIFKNNLINRPIELTTISPVKNIRKYKREHELKRIELRKSHVTIWRKYINIILNIAIITNTGFITNILRSLEKFVQLYSCRVYKTFKYASLYIIRKRI